MADSTSKQAPPFYHVAIKENNMVSFCYEIKTKLLNATEPMETSAEELNTTTDSVMLGKRELLFRLNAAFQGINTVCLAEYREQCHTEALLSCLDPPSEPTGRNA